MSDRPVLYLIDGHAVAYRQYHAMKGPGFATSLGEPTNATFGFTRTLLDLLDTQPPYLAVSFDQGLSGREELYPDYKGNRDEMPDDLRVQIARIQQLVSSFNIPLLTMEGMEADDLIGTVTSQARAQGVDVCIITGDRDLLQLLEEGVVVRLPQRQQGSGGPLPDKEYDVAEFRARYALEPHQLIDLKALMGDSSDNIPGVKGVGEKTATQLLQTYGTLDNIYANLSEIKESVRNKLIESREMAYLSQRLATIIRDVPYELSLEACVARDYDPRRVDAVLAEVEFNSLRERFRLVHPDLVFDPPFEHETIVVRTSEELAHLARILAQAEAIVWDVETTSVDQMQAELVGIALAVDDKTGYYVPVGHVGAGAGTLFAEVAEEQLPLDEVLSALRGPLTSPSIPKIAHNATYDLVVMQRYGINVSPVGFDTMVAEWMRDPISNNLGLKKYARNELNITMTEISDLIGSGKKQRLMSEVPIDEAAPYAAADAVVTYLAAQDLRRKLADIDSLVLFEKLEVPLIPIIAAMEQAGALLDTAYLADLSERLQARIDALEQTIYSQSGGYGPFNINSPRQLNDVLFETLRLPVAGLKKTTHGYSTDVVTLEALRHAHPIVPNVMEHRELVKLKGTYVDALPALIHPQTGRVHTSYNQTGTSTGRFSSSNPNLQNIPIRTELGREVRKAFIAPPGYALVAVDYSQIELRVMAHISQDATLIEAFKQGQDIHRATAATVYGIDAADVTYDQRNFAKRVNFGLMYGMGAFRLARDSDLTLAEAEGFIDTYFERMPGVKQYIENTKQFAIEQGYVQTLMGRKRYFPRLMNTPPNSQGAQADLRAAINMPIQGTAADILKLAMLRLYDELQARQHQARMILQVHDELVLEVPEETLHATTQLVVDVMQSAYDLAVPLVANAEHGTNWLEMTAFEG